MNLKTEALQIESNRARSSLDQLKTLEGELAGVKVERDAGAKEKEEACEEAELTLLQLHQVQEKLEHQFSEMCAQDDLLRKHLAQSLAMRKVISKFVISQS